MRFRDNSEDPDSSRLVIAGTVPREVESCPGTLACRLFGAIVSLGVASAAHNPRFRDKPSTDAQHHLSRI